MCPILRLERGVRPFRPSPLSLCPRNSPKSAPSTRHRIPDRLYFKIGDVAELCGVETYVLRFWESQFPLLKPNKSGTGQRLYRRRDVELALEIKRLVHAEGYTRRRPQVLEQVHRRPGPQPAPQLTPHRAPVHDSQFPPAAPRQ